MKQTLANATRFVTQELKEKEEQILHAQETKVKLEQSLFSDLLLRIKKIYLIFMRVHKHCLQLMY